MAILVLIIRGISGNPSEEDLNKMEWKEEGPFELSNERGRFALLYSWIENHSLYFSKNLALFASPDLAYKDGKYVSLFNPGVSFMAIPGYMLGKILGISQIFTFLIISLFASLNVVLVKNISRKIGASDRISTIASLIFLFATPALVYATSFYQHHISTFLLLLSIYLLLEKVGIFTLFLVFFLYGVSITVDYPNVFLMFPIVVYSMSRFFIIVKTSANFQIVFDLKKLISLTGVLVPLLFLFWFNKVSYGSALSISGAVQRVTKIDPQGNPIRDENIANIASDTIDRGLSFFKTRNIPRGIYTLILSEDRGVIFFAPVLIFSLIGILEFGEKRRKIFLLLASIICINVLLYSMWGDPWGGWSFGSRYLIPSYAIVSIFISRLFMKLKGDKLFLGVFFLASVVSIFINLLGAITSKANPPKVEAESLTALSGIEQKYTIERNLDFLFEKGTKSFVYEKYLKDFLTPWEYYFLVSFLILIPYGIYFFKISRLAKSPVFELVLVKNKGLNDLKLELRLFSKEKLFK